MSNSETPSKKTGSSQAAEASKSKSVCSPSKAPGSSERLPQSGFEMYCQDMRPIMALEHCKHMDEDLDEELISGWYELSDEQRTGWDILHREAEEAHNRRRFKDRAAGASGDKDEDVEMMTSRALPIREK